MSPRYCVLLLAFGFAAVGWTVRTVTAPDPTPAALRQLVDPTAGAQVQAEHMQSQLAGFVPVILTLYIAAAVLALCLRSRRRPAEDIS